MQGFHEDADLRGCHHNGHRIARNDELLSGLGLVSGPDDVTALIVLERPSLPLPRLYRYAQECKPPPEPGLFIREGRVYFYACDEAEATHYEELWAQHLRDLRQRLGDPGRH